MWLCLIFEAFVTDSVVKRPKKFLSFIVGENIAWTYWGDAVLVFGSNVVAIGMFVSCFNVHVSKNVQYFECFQ